MLPENLLTGNKRKESKNRGMISPRSGLKNLSKNVDLAHLPPLTGEGDLPSYYKSNGMACTEPSFEGAGLPPG